MGRKTAAVILVMLVCFFAPGVHAAVKDDFRDHPQKPYLLPEAELKKIKENLRQRCNLQETDARSYPWYYHYELGLAMIKANDWQRALESLVEAVDRRSKPSRFSRTYGMWYINYRPYYHIGLAHYRLNNWDCAVRAFEASEKLEEGVHKSGEAENLQLLKANALRRLATPGSSD